MDYVINHNSRIAFWFESHFIDLFLHSSAYAVMYMYYVTSKHNASTQKKMIGLGYPMSAFSTFIRIHLYEFRKKPNRIPKGWLNVSTALGHMLLPLEHIWADNRAAGDYPICLVLAPIIINSGAFKQDT